MQQPQPGQILFYENYKFEDGSSKDKLFVILCISDINSPCLVLKTTSQSKRYKNCLEGCDLKNRSFFVPLTWNECFPLDTYIQLPEIIEIPSAEIFAGTLARKMHIKNALSYDCFQKLKSCLRKFKNDISLEHRKLIF